ncbi:hypothetical protein ACLKA7_013559 [Drosophila subpalustris]
MERKRKPNEFVTPYQSDSHLDEDSGSGNTVSAQVSENDHNPPRPILVSTGINTIPRHARTEETLKSSSSASSKLSKNTSFNVDHDRESVRIRNKDANSDSSDSVLSDRSSRASVINSIVSFTLTAKEGCTEGLTGFIVTAVSMLLLIMISWFLISQMDFFYQCLSKAGLMLYKAGVKIIAVFQASGERSKHLRRPKEEEDEIEIELRDKSDKCVHPILEELIHTEEAYVKNLFTGLENYGNIFQRKDLPLGLRGKKYDLFGNIEQIAEFHRDEFLPMLHRNRRDLKRLFDEFLEFLDQNCFYGYVIFTMNKQKSLKLCDLYKNYFTSIRLERDDKLGINSFLVQPIQRMARYPLLLTQFINTFFKNRDIVMKPLIESCCRLEKRLRTLLTTTNESEVINDIVDCNEFNVYYQGKFRKVSEFQVTDHKLKRSYRAKVFIFDKCIIYTEIKGKHLVFHGRYPCEHVGISARTKSFTLYYERRKQQECEFAADAAQIQLWLDLIRDMINNFANEERQKLQERYTRENDHLHRKAPSFSLFRDSNRFSSDSGIGNIWIMPKPDEDTANNRTTWYAAS